MKCLSCGKREATKHPTFSWMPCLKCQQRHRDITKPKETIEVTSNDIKQDRKIHRESIIQPFREGVLSKEYTDVYGTDGINVTKEEVKNARPVWGHTYYKDD